MNGESNIIKSFVLIILRYADALKLNMMKKSYKNELLQKIALPKSDHSIDVK